jgi:hypothetical protein
MHKLIEKLEKEEGLTVDTFEVWHNKENEKKLLAIDTNLCGGVPFFYNEKTKKFICGEADYDTVKKWAKGEDFEQE